MVHHYKKIFQSDIDNATYRHLKGRNPISAAKPFAFWQSFSLGIFLGFMVAGIFYYSHTTLVFLSNLLFLIFFLILGLKIVILCLELFFPLKAVSPKALLKDHELPLYSVLLPLYKEKRSVSSILSALSQMDYPKEKIEIFLLLEENDEETIHGFIACQDQFSDLNITIMVLAEGYPQTKPRALNAALPHISGEYFTVFDAEDRPEPLQLRKAATAFQELPADVAALQARLTFYNAKRNILTKSFTIEYDIWFHHYLSGLVRLAMPIPLAGTSTHFRTIDVKRVGGWDAFNVTEDCDLGIRFAKAGLRTVMLDSDTLEEAPIALEVWFKQRTRWLKGYMQTQFVHSGRLLTNIMQLGLYKFAAMCLIVGGQVLLAFLYPVAIFSFIYHFFADIFLWQSFLYKKLIPINNIMLYLGLFIPVIQAFLVYFRLKRKLDLLPIGCFHPLYWMVASFASYRALWQLVTAPSYWEKTPHGIDIEET